MGDIDIDNFLANGGGDEWAVSAGYIHKDDILEKLSELEREITSLSVNIQLFKIWVKE